MGGEDRSGSASVPAGAASGLIRLWSGSTAAAPPWVVHRLRVDLVCQPGARVRCRVRPADAPRGTSDVTEVRPSHRSDASGDGVTLRLLWPQWQGAGTCRIPGTRAGIPGRRGPPGLRRWLGDSRGGPAGERRSDCGGAGRDGRCGAGAARRRDRGQAGRPHPARRGSELEALIDPALAIHLVSDTGSSHRSTATKKWLAEHSRFVVHHTPVHASCVEPGRSVLLDPHPARRYDAASRLTRRPRRRNARLHRAPQPDRPTVQTGCTTPRRQHDLRSTNFCPAQR